MKRIMMILTIAAIMTVSAVITSPLPAIAQTPPCGHDYCNWYQACHWEYWAWDAGSGWVLLTTDGSC